MNQAVANIIKTHIEGLDFIDKIAGLTAVTYFDVKNKDGELVQKAVPIACCVTADDCKEGAYNDLMPDSKYKTVIYFEDRGVKFLRKESHWKYYQSDLRLVCWINIAKILGDDCKTGTACTLAAHLIAEIVRVLPEFPQHHSPFNFVYSEVVSQDIRSNSIFAAYTYDEKHSQYLMYPYDYFALDIQTLFAICIDGSGVYDSDCGHTIVDLDAPVATTATDKTATGFTANWNAVGGATGYLIEIATDSAFTSIVADEDVGNVLTIPVDGLVAGTTYYYRIRAYSDTNTSDNSNTITVTMYDDWFMPSKDELTLMYNILKVSGLGSFISFLYSSSSENDATTFHAINFQNGLDSTQNKSSFGSRTRACRLFTSTVNYNLRDIGPAGGYIFWKSGNDYLEAAPIDCNQGAGYIWSTVTNLAIGTTLATIGTGQANTTAIIGQAGHSASSAKLCNDLVI
jgi:hypothetical protein